MSLTRKNKNKDTQVQENVWLIIFTKNTIVYNVTCYVI